MIDANKAYFSNIISLVILGVEVANIIDHEGGNQNQYIQSNLANWIDKGHCKIIRRAKSRCDAILSHAH